MITTQKRFKKGRILEDDYPVFYSYLYMADGKIIQSDICGTISDLKRDIRRQGYSANEICAVEWNWG